MGRFRECQMSFMEKIFKSSRESADFLDEPSCLLLKSLVRKEIVQGRDCPGHISSILQITLASILHEYVHLDVLNMSNCENTPSLYP